MNATHFNHAVKLTNNEEADVEVYTKGTLVLEEASKDEDGKEIPAKTQPAWHARVTVLAQLQKSADDARRLMVAHLRAIADDLEKHEL